MKSDVFNILVNTLQGRRDVQELSFKENDFYSIRYERDETEMYDNCLFSNVSDDEAVLLMRFFADKSARMIWNLNIEFAKLLANKGNLLDEDLFNMLENQQDKRWSEYFLHQAFYGSSLKYEDKVISLLEESPEDGRDGIFIACYKLNTMKIYEILVKMFEQWMQDPDWDAGTGEYHALLRFLSLWDDSPSFNKHNTLRKMIKKRAICF